MNPKTAITSFAVIFALACASHLAAGVYGPAPYQENLLTNPNGSSGNLGGWTITSDGGNGWAVHTEYFPDETEDDGFLTSYGWAQRKQVVDLVQLGFTPEYLDTQPAIVISEMFEKVFCPDFFFLTVDLLGSGGNLIHSWSSGQLQHGDAACDYSGYKDQISTKLTNYGPGVRFIRWSDGGKDSEYWHGHFGPKLQNAYLALLPANLLYSPGEISSWNVSLGHTFELTGPPQSRQFRTSFGWSRRQQTIDLLGAGLTANQLDSGELPIIAEGTYREVACPDDFYLKVELLDQFQQVLVSQDSGVKTHSGECDWTYSLYGETIHHRFDNYPAGVRFIRWEDGGKDREYWAGHFGAILEAPYLGIVNNEAWQSGEGRILEARDYGLMSESDGSALYRTPADRRILNKVSAHPTDSQNPPESSVALKMQQIRWDISQSDSTDMGTFWELTTNNDDVEIYSSPPKAVCFEFVHWPSGPPTCQVFDLSAANQELLAAMSAMIRRGTEYIDITSLNQIDPEWKLAIKTALNEVERNALRDHTLPIVRIHLGLDPITHPYAGEWNTHLRSLLDDLTDGLLGTSEMRIYVSGGRRSSTVSFMSWNHAKIVAVDGKEAIVGGHNMLSAYFGNKPIFDTSVKVTGDAAWSAHRFVTDVITDHSRNNFISPGNIGHSYYWYRGTVTIPTSIPTTVRSGPPSYGAIEILGVGQLSADGPSPLKMAVKSMLKTARKSIYLSQQSLTHIVTGSGVDADLAKILADKAIDEGVKVSIVLSDPDAGDHYEASADVGTTLTEIWENSGRTTQNDLSARFRFCENLSVASLRISLSHSVYPGTDEHFKNHSKTIMIDNQVFMIGSHNLYGQAPAQHNEYAYIIGNAAKADEFTRKYWQPVLEYSAKTALDQAACLSSIEQ